MRLTALSLLAAFLIASATRAEDAFFSLRVSGLEITEGELPRGEANELDARQLRRSQAMRPYVVLDGAGEAYVINNNPSAPLQWPFCVRAEAGADVTGRLFLPKPDMSGLVQLKFKIASSAKSDSARDLFYAAKVAHYQRLLDEGAPGAAWFRYQIRSALSAVGKASAERIARLQPARSDEMIGTFSLFSGGRAVSENLQLDRLLPPVRANGGAELVDVTSIPGITVPEIDWTKLTKDLSPELDPLARHIPADQHVVFFPSMGAFARVADEAELHGTPVLGLVEPRAEDAGTRERYERQLGVSLQDAARLLGPDRVRSLALTGSDVNFRTGTDVALLLETAQPEEVERLLLAQVTRATAVIQQEQVFSRQAGGMRYLAAVSPDRAASCYIARLDGAVVITNSTYQLERLASVRGGSPALAGLPEYRFFRNRYRRGDKDEAALAFLSDATIRRWCGPRWRIATSRRLRDLAVMTELEATHLDKIVLQKVEPGPIQTDLLLSTGGELTLSSSGVRSSTWGPLDFLAPIAEVPLEKVSRAEADAYGEWRRNYQSNWSGMFDPIAIRLTVETDKLAADVSVMPLILGSQYNLIASVAQGGEIKPGAGDPHDDVMHFVMSLNTKSPLVQLAMTYVVANLAPDSRQDPTGWLGQAIAVYADDDPAWEQMAKVDPELWDRDLPGQAARLPLAVWVEITNPVRATAFMTAARARRTDWESRTHQGQPYTKVTPARQGRGPGGARQNLSVYYAVIDEALLVSLSETVIQHAIDRLLQRRQEKGAQPTDTTAAARPWLGSNVALRIDRKVMTILSAVTRRDYQHMMQALAWRSLPILNEWKRLYPDRDPLTVHLQVWKVRLICPGGGQYVWNDEWQTMESTVYGHPGDPKEGPTTPPAIASLFRADFGLTFEEQGLRARAVLEREPSKTAPATDAR